MMNDDDAHFFWVEEKFTTPNAYQATRSMGTESTQSQEIDPIISRLNRFCASFRVKSGSGRSPAKNRRAKNGIQAGFVPVTER